MIDNTASEAETDDIAFPPAPRASRLEREIAYRMARGVEYYDDDGARLDTVAQVMDVLTRLGRVFGPRDATRVQRATDGIPTSIIHLDLVKDL